jgi:hypothetical protein
VRRCWYPSNRFTLPSNDGIAPSLLSGLSAFWKLENVNDSSPNGYTLTNNNTVTFPAGKVGNGASLGAASNQWLSRASNANLQATPTQSLSVSCWVRHTTLQSLCGAVNKGSPAGGAGTNEGWGLEFIGSATNKWRFILRNATDTSSFSISSTVVCTTATWYHLAAWWDSVGKVIGISVNGETPVTVSYPTGGYADNKDLNIGYWVGSGVRTNGNIDAVGIWTRVITASERAALYSGGLGLEYPF